jgi:hypothetical protein
LAVEEPVVADAVEARRQNMHQEAADELVGDRASSACRRRRCWRALPMRPGRANC